MNITSVSRCFPGVLVNSHTFSIRMNNEIANGTRNQFHWTLVEIVELITFLKKKKMCQILMSHRDAKQMWT